MTSSRSDAGKQKLPDLPQLEMTEQAVLQEFVHYFSRMLGRRELQGNSPVAYEALVHTVRDRLTERWIASTRAAQESGSRRVCYLSMEYLMGRLLRNALLSLGLDDECSMQTLSGCGFPKKIFTPIIGKLPSCFLCS